MKGADQRLRALDGLRGVCALFVVIFHCDLFLHSNYLLNHGWLAVDVFFVLSGFVIALRYEEKLRRRGGFLEFLSARAVRLLPVHMLGTIAVAAVLFAKLAAVHPVAAFVPGLGLALLLGLLLIPLNSLVTGQLPASDQAFPVNPPLWSLLGEWIANILYGAALHRLKTWHASALIAICWAFLLAHAWQFQHWWDTGDRIGQYFPASIRATSGFMAGVVVYRLFALGRLNRLASVRPELVYASCFFVASIPRVVSAPAFVFELVFEFLAATLGASAAVALLATSQRSVPQIFVWLGAISYPLYASHMAVLEFASRWLKDGPRHSAVLAIPMVAVAVGLAIAIGKVAELITGRARYSEASPRLAARTP